MSKEEMLLKLAKKRQQTRWEGFANIGDFHDGKYECDYVSPRSKSACNPNAKILFVLQDWVGADYLNGEYKPFLKDLGFDPGIKTNKVIHNAIRRHFNIQYSETYITNIFPFIKFGANDAPIAPAAYKRGALEFFAPLAEILNPNIIVCCGKPAYSGACQAFKKSEVSTLDEAISRPFRVNNTIVYAVGHPSRGTRGWEQIKL